MPEEESMLPSGEKSETAPLSSREASVAATEGVIRPLEQVFVPDMAAEKSEGTYHEILSKVARNAQSSAPQDDASVALDTKSISETTDEESRVQQLLNLATTKGVGHAVKVAQSLRDFYALDRMHDELAGKLYEGLLKLGLITKE